MRKSEAEYFRKAFDLSLTAQVFIEVVKDESHNAKFVMKHFNFEMMRLTKTRIINFYNADFVETFSHRPDLIEKLLICFKEKTFVDYENAYRVRTTGTDRYFCIRFVYLDESSIILYVTDKTKEHEFRMKVAGMVHMFLNWKERDIVYYLACGHSRAEIAGILNIDIKVVYNMITLIRQKSGGDLSMMIEHEKLKMKNA